MAEFVHPLQVCAYISPVFSVCGHALDKMTKCCEGIFYLMPTLLFQRRQWSLSWRQPVTRVHLSSRWIRAQQRRGKEERRIPSKNNPRQLLPSPQNQPNLTGERGCAIAK